MEPLFTQKNQVVIFDTSNVVGRIGTVIEGNTTQFLDLFLRSLLKYRKTLTDTSTWIWAIEGGGKARRQRHFYKYKRNKRPATPILKELIPLALEVLSFVECEIVQAAKGEADDAIATYIHKELEADPWFKCVVVSEDKDLWQLIKDPAVEILIQKGRTRLTEALVSSKLKGVSPTHIALLKALVGDTSDNLPKVSGLGRKESYKLARLYNTPKQLLRALKHKNALKLLPRVTTKILEAKDQIKMVYRLVKLKQRLQLTTTQHTSKPKRLRKFLQNHEVFNFSKEELTLITSGRTESESHS